MKYLLLALLIFQVVQTGCAKSSPPTAVSRCGEECNCGKKLNPSIYYTPVLTKGCDDGAIGLVRTGGRIECDPQKVRYNVRNLEGSGIVLNSAGFLRAVLQLGDERGEREPTTGMILKEPTRCQLGFGSGSKYCLNPFKSVACSPGLRIGDVIFVRAAVGLEYPSFPGQTEGEMNVHDGYFYCIDRGSKIIDQDGAIRVDFFVGLLDDRPSTWKSFKKSKTKSFYSLFSDSKTSVEYCTVSDSKRVEVLKANNVIDENNRLTGELPPEVIRAYENPTYLAKLFSLAPKQYAEVIKPIPATERKAN